jgi:hypothetical protein
MVGCVVSPETWRRALQVLSEKITALGLSILKLRSRLSVV